MCRTAARDPLHSAPPPLRRRRTPGPACRRAGRRPPCGPGWPPERAAGLYSVSGRRRRPARGIYPPRRLCAHGPRRAALCQRRPQPLRRPGPPSVTAARDRAPPSPCPGGCPRRSRGISSARCHVGRFRRRRLPRRHRRPRPRRRKNERRRGRSLSCSLPVSAGRPRRSLQEGAWRRSAPTYASLERSFAPIFPNVPRIGSGSRRESTARTVARCGTTISAR
jgi:hypothetical protein